MSDTENSSNHSQLPTHVKKKYKLYNADSSIQILLRTLNRWRSRGYSFGEFHDDNGSNGNDQNIDTDFNINYLSDNELSISDDNVSVSSESSSEESLIQFDSDEEFENDKIRGDESDLNSEEDYVDREINEDVDVENIEIGNESEMVDDNSEVTVNEAVFNLLNSDMKHNISKAALQESLKMQLKLLPNNNQMPKTVYKLFQYVQKISPPCRIIKHYYCKKCVCNVEIKVLNKKEIFKCPSCKITDQRDILFFHEFDICDQIKILFEKYNLSEKLKSPKLENIGNISSVVDGSEYIRVNSRNNSGNFDLTLILNTDGLSLVKSSKSHCWPVLFTIAAIPEDIRDNYVIFAGVWYDNVNKPPMNVFLKPICLKIRKRFFEGIDWVNQKSGKQENTKIVAPLVIADAPARAQLQNVLNFNGRYGCNICEIRTVRCKKIVGKRTVRIYPVATDCRLRTGRRMKAQAKKMRQLVNKNQIRGVKGHTVLSYLPLIDIGTCVLPEYMYSVLLGVVKQFLGIWFDKKGPWNIKNKTEAIDNDLLSIQPPQSFSRLPRHLSHYKLYKASENYNFLMFYSPPTLVLHLPDKYFQHWLLLVKSTFNFVKTTITGSDIDESDNLLELFVSQIENLYSNRDLSHNCHQLRHLALCVRRWGPLRSTSAFVFKNYNGFVAKCVHGSKNFGQEIVNSIQIAQGVQILKNCIDERTTNIREVNKLNHELLGNKIANMEFDINENNLFLSHNFEVENLSIYARLRIDKTIDTSEIYKTIKTNSYTVQIEVNDCIIYGSIKFFVEFQNDIFLFIRHFTVDYVKMFCHISSRTIIEHIIPIVDYNCLMLLKLKDIKSIIQLIKVGNYVCKQPNNFNIVW